MPHFDRALLETPAATEEQARLRAILGSAEGAPPTLADRFGILPAASAVRAAPAPERVARTVRSAA